ncbi:MAG: MFS transporter [Alphaproteobacteria bacterium]
MLALFLTVFIDLVGFGIIIPFLPFFAEHFAASPDVVTLLIAVFPLTQFLFAPLWGRLSDRMGRKPVLLMTLAGLFASYIWLGLSQGLWMLFAARAFAGAMAGNIAVAQAYVADVTPSERRAEGLGRIGAAFGLGFLLGPAIGGVLAGPDPQNPNILLPALAAAAMTATAFCFALAFLEETVGADVRAEAKGAPPVNRIALMTEALRRPRLGVLLAMLFLLPFTFSGLESTLALWTEREFGWGAQQNGYVYSYLGLIAVVTQGGLIGPLTRHLGEKRLLVLGPALIGLGFASIPLAPALFLTLAAFGLVVLGVSIANPTIYSLISQQAGRDERGRFLGVAQSTASLARIAGPAWAGFCFVTFGRDWPYFVAAALMVVMLVLGLKAGGAKGARAKDRELTPRG